MNAQCSSKPDPWGPPSKVRNTQLVTTTGKFDLGDLLNVKQEICGTASCPSQHSTVLNLSASFFFFGPLPYVFPNAARTKHGPDKLQGPLSPLSHFKAPQVKFLPLLFMKTYLCHLHASGAPATGSLRAWRSSLLAWYCRAPWQAEENLQGESS